MSIPQGVEIQEPRVCNDLLDNPEELREFFLENGYVFLRGLIAPEDTLKVRKAFGKVCEENGYIKPGTEPEDRMFNTEKVPVYHLEEGYWPMHDALQNLEEFHTIPHNDAVLGTVRKLLSTDQVLVQPRHIARCIMPGPKCASQNTKAHQDWVYGQGSQNFLTCWMPFNDVPKDMGGLWLAAGSHKGGPALYQPAEPPGGMDVAKVALEAHKGPFVSTDYKEGDVMFFNCLVIHGALPQTRGEQMRFSGDFRYQPAAEPVGLPSMMPHCARCSWDEMYAKWNEPKIKNYWKELEDLKVVNLDATLLPVDLSTCFRALEETAPGFDWESIDRLELTESGNTVVVERESGVLKASGKEVTEEWWGKVTRTVQALPAVKAPEGEEDGETAYESPIVVSAKGATGEIAVTMGSEDPNGHTFTKIKGPDGKTTRVRAMTFFCMMFLGRSRDFGTFKG